MVSSYCSLGKSITTAILLIASSCLTIQGVQAQKLTGTSKPNIIFILADDVGYDNLGINGGQSYSTPNIDSMARHGINFTHCESSPLCCTSRSMFLTGKYLNRNYNNWGYMSEKEKTIANVMHDAGYATGIFGKLQFQYSVAAMSNWGWDTHVVFELTEDTMAYRRYKNPVLKQNGYRLPDSVTANKYGDDILTDKLLKFIDNNKTRPFFACYSMSLGHPPFCPTPDDKAFTTWHDNQQSDTSYFPSMMKYMDKKVGVILNKLRATRLANNTIVVYTGDNGTSSFIFYNANNVRHIQGEKGKTTEGGTHVPLIVYWPGHIPPGTINDDLVDFTDFLPTFAQAAGINDLSAYGKLDGLSFYQKILGKPDKIKKQLYCFFAPENQNNDSLRIWVRDKTYKLYDSTGISKAGKFYNTVDDPEELSPLIDSKLTAYEKSLKTNFKLILDTSYSWPASPEVIRPFVIDITSSSATIGASIISAGATKLIERGSSVTSFDKIFLSSNRLRDNTAQLEKFSQKRTGLKPQTQYKYILYAINNNASHSTGYVKGTFTTLSTSPLAQPGEFTATKNNTVINLKWNHAKFPTSGAKNAGYLLVYSKDSIRILQNPDGRPPGSVVVNGKIVPTVSTGLPIMPAVSATIPGLTPGTYKFLLIPYTWDGSNAATYNYLTKNALTTKATIQSFVFNNAAVTKTALPVSSGKPVIYPDPSTGNINISYDHSSTGETQIQVFDIAGKIAFTKMAKAIKGNNICNLDLSGLKPGTYYLELTDGGERNRVKFIIQK